MPLMLVKYVWTPFFFFALALNVSQGMAVDGDVEATMVPIEEVKIMRLPSFPTRVEIIVYGQRILGVEIDVKQERRDAELVANMTQTHLKQIQTGKVPFTQRVFLKGGFMPGTYLLKVNTFSTTFEVK